jgi:hypothetical protein
VLAIAGGRRLLTAEITVSYAVKAYSGMTADKLIANFHSSVDTGAFLMALKADSGLPITSMTGTVTTNMTPTPSPTSSPVPSTTGGDCCAAIIQLLFISVFQALLVFLQIQTCTPCVHAYRRQPIISSTFYGHLLIRMVGCEETTDDNNNINIVTACN